jgi:sugar/nucleoside kinase (ribokinase family)
MTVAASKPTIFGTGLIALDLVMGAEPESPVRSWAGGTCGNVLTILAFLGWSSFPIARMNGDPASQRVKADMKRWGVRMDFSGCGPKCHTPIVIQTIRKRRDGLPTHRFSWSCPRCGRWLPGFRAVTQEAIETVSPSLRGTSAFFIDRLSRAGIELAKLAAAEGAVVVFEPSAKSDAKLLREALKVAHIVKYASQRMPKIDDIMVNGTSVLLEVQTLGSEGLRYRHRFDDRPSAWVRMDAVHAPKLADTCGAGDWCTAGLIAKAAARGLAGLRKGGADSVQQALRFGQTLAAWNCGFEGARGGMYAMTREAFEGNIEDLLAGRESTAAVKPTSGRTVTVSCPACPPVRFRRRRAQSGRRKRAA